MDNEERQNQQQTNVDESQTEQQGTQEQGSKVTFTDDQQAAIDKMVAGIKAKQEDKFQAKVKAAQDKFEQEKADAVKKAQERAKMTEQERQEAERKDREAAMQKERQELAQQKREFATKSMLLDKGISTDMLPLVMGADDDATSQNLELLDAYVNKKVQEATEKLLKGKQNPSTGNGGQVAPAASNPWSKDGWNLTKQQQIYSTDPEKASQMIAQAQPKQGFYFGKNN